MDSIWNMMWGTWTNFFERILGPGGGNVFFLVPIMVLTVGLWFKNPNQPLAALVFLIGSCALWGSANIFVGAYNVGYLFLIITALGMTGLVLKTLFQKGG
jgi:hypothetical protein